MKLKTSIILSLLFLTQAAYSQVQFSSGSWPEILDQAKKEGRYIFVDAYTDWCVWCKEMDNRTFSRQDVGDQLNTAFIPVKMDMEKDFGVKMAMKYRVSSFPTYLVFSPEGNLADVLHGFQEAEPFLASLQHSLDPAKRKGYAGISDTIELAFPDFYVYSFKGNSKGKVVKADSAAVAKYLTSGGDLFSEVNWCVMTRFIRNQPWHQEFILNNKEKYVSLYGKQEVDGVIETIISSKINYAIKAKNEKMFEMALALADKHLDDPEGKTKRHYRITYYKETGQWIKMDKLVMDMISTDGFTEDLNEYAWTIYEKCNEPVVIKDAINWMKQLTAKSPTYPSLDTYAALLYKDKQYMMAMQVAQQALDTGREKDQDVTETEALFEKIKNAKK